MPARIMSITMEEDLYRTLNQTVGPRGMSRFIAEALEEKLSRRKEPLVQEYVAAQRDRQRQKDIQDWTVTEIEDW